MLVELREDSNMEMEKKLEKRLRRQFFSGLLIGSGIVMSLVGLLMPICATDIAGLHNLLPVYVLVAGIGISTIGQFIK